MLSKYAIYSLQVEQIVTGEKVKEDERQFYKVRPFQVEMKADLFITEGNE